MVASVKRNVETEKSLWPPGEALLDLASVHHTSVTCHTFQISQPYFSSMTGSSTSIPPSALVVFQAVSRYHPHIPLTMLQDGKHVYPAMQSDGLGLDNVIFKYYDSSADHPVRESYTTIVCIHGYTFTAGQSSQIFVTQSLSGLFAF